MVLLETVLALFAAVTMLAVAAFYSLDVITVLLPISIFTFAAGLISLSSNAGALVALRHLAGTASSVAGTGLYAMSAILSTIATALPLTTLWPLTISVSIIAILAFITFLLMVFLPYYE